MEAHLDMSRFRYENQEYDAGGLDWPRAMLLVIGLALLAPALFLGIAGAFAWRRWGWSRRATLVVCALSLAPAVAAVLVWHVQPISTFLDAHLTVVTAAWSAMFGHGYRAPITPTPTRYLLAVGPATLPMACLVALVANWKRRPRQSILLRREAGSVRVPRHVERRAAGGVKHPAGGWALGYRADGKPVSLSDAEARHHVLISGATGAGKSTVLRHLLAGVAHRCPVVILDCKASPTIRRAVEAIPGSVVWSIGGEVRWDALHGDPTCFAAKLLAAEQFGPNAAIYRAAAERYVQWVGALLDSLGWPRDPTRIAELLSPRALATLLEELRAEAPADWLARHAAPVRRRLGEMGRAAEEGVDGFAQRFGVVAEGVAGRSLGAGPDALLLEHAVAAGRVVLFSLDAAAYPTLAAKLGAWVLLDLGRVAGLLQAAGGEGTRLYVAVDEFSALGAEGRQIVPLLARAREAGVACVVATQGLADLERVDRTLPQQIVQNVAVRVLLRQQTAEDALAWARHLGELEREELSRRLEPGGWFGSSERDTGAWSTHWRRDFHVRPEELQALGTGDAILHVVPLGRAARRLERLRVARPAPLPTPPVEWAPSTLLAPPPPLRPSWPGARPPDPNAAGAPVVPPRRRDDRGMAGPPGRARAARTRSPAPPPHAATELEPEPPDPADDPGERR
jgi:Type IV secretion-system coupling protein DNA-binding domain/FtsK/SpoIIIE family